MFVVVSIFGVLAAPVVALVWTVGWAQEPGAWHKWLSPLCWLVMTLVFAFLIFVVTAVTAVVAALVVMWVVSNLHDQTMRDAYEVSRTWAWPLSVPLNLVAFAVLRRWDMYAFRY